MQDHSTFSIVPITEVPHLESVAVANGLEALLLNQGQATDAPIEALDQRAACFEVNGLPRDHKAWIRQEDGQCHLVFERYKGESEWLGKYCSVVDALQALSKKLT